MSKLRRTAARATFLIALACFFSGDRGLAQDAQEQNQNIIRANVNLVMVDATVKTKAGQIMANLKKEDFELREDGIVQKLDVFSRDELPLNRSEEHTSELQS